MQVTVIDGSGRRVVPVETTPFTIGRSAENHLQLADAHVSRKHAIIVQEGDGWHVRDCGSRFGTFVNSERVTDRRLEPGDRILLGQTELLLDVAEAGTLSSGAFEFRQVAALLAGLRALGSTRVVDEVLALVLDSALELTGAERGFILLAEDNGPLALKLARARGGITLATAKTSQRIPEEVFTTGTDRVVTDLLDDAHASLHAGTVALGIRHVVCTPLTVVQYGADAGARRIGVLYLDSRERGYLQTVGVLHALAAEAAVVIENARLYKEVIERERAAQELRIAAQIQQALLPAR
jgi:pSer/pThr/pTyr-binding forkhead associated (FHA) protein